MYAIQSLTKVVCPTFCPTPICSLELKLSSPTPSVFCMWSTGVRDHDGLVRHIAAARAPLRANAHTMVYGHIKEKKISCRFVSSFLEMNLCELVCNYHILWSNRVAAKVKGKSMWLHRYKHTHRVATEKFKGVFSRHIDGQRSEKFLIQGKMLLVCLLHSFLSTAEMYLCFKKKKHLK